MKAAITLAVMVIFVVLLVRGTEKVWMIDAPKPQTALEYLGPDWATSINRCKERVADPASVVAQFGQYAERIIDDCKWFIEKDGLYHKAEASAP
jgi:hypothetical protein